MSSKHILAYARPDVITDWKSLLDGGDGSSLPFLYGSDDDRVFAGAACPGTTLWIVSTTVRGRPPALTARIQVTGRLDKEPKAARGLPPGVVRTFLRKYRYVVVGEPCRSRFFGYNNAANALSQLTVRWTKTCRLLSPDPACNRKRGPWRNVFGVPLNRPAPGPSRPDMRRRC